RPGDRFEKHRPPYAAVELEQTAPRDRLPIHTVGLTPDRRTLVLSTAAHRPTQPHALTLPGLGRPEKGRKGEVSQIPETDLYYDLCGLEASWRAEGAEPISTWLPHP